MPASDFTARLRKFGTVAQRGAARAGHAFMHAPWKRIGMWTGMVVGSIVAGFALFLTFADWNAFRGPIARGLSLATGREIVIAGDLHVHPWSLAPEFSADRVTVGNPAKFRDRGRFAEIGHVDAAIQLFPLLIGRIEVKRLDMRDARAWLYRAEDGAANFLSQQTALTAATTKASNLPAIQHFSLRNGQLSLIDVKRHMTLSGGFNTQESIEPGDPGRFALTGDGLINGKPFRVEFTGAALINVRRDRPYPFNADVHAGGTRLIAQGTVTHPFDFNYFGANVEGSGPDLADLYYLLGLTLPNTPPYRLVGHVERDGLRYTMRDLSGHVGQSDLAGAFSVVHHGDRPFLEGQFHSRNLEFGDLVAVLGGGPAGAERGRPASGAQRSAAVRLAVENRLLPDAPLDIHRVRNMDARVRYDAAHVHSTKVPLRGFGVDISLNRGLLRLDPMTLELAQGHVAGMASINARMNPPLVNIDARLSNARLENFIPTRGSRPLVGSVLGRARLTGRGASVRTAAANADGQIAFAVPHGEVREAFAELTGINVTRGLGLLLAHNEHKIDIRCGVADFRVRNGQLAADNITFDTRTMLIRGRGGLSLRDESLDLRIQGQPKKARLIRLAAPITLTGHLRDPHVGVDIGHAAGQGGIAAALATMLSPVAAVLPFIDTGLAHDADCGTLLASANVGATHRTG